MSAADDAYAVLGLDPGADAVAIERAFKRLIKAHHPDRPGGDSARAAELNHAYRELRQRLNLKGDVAMHAALVRNRNHWSRAAWIAALFVVLGAAALVASALSPMEVVPDDRAFAARVAKQGNRIKADIMDRPLNLAAIDAAVLDAVRLGTSGDDHRLADETRRCHRDLRIDPDLSRFDRCAAFDNAVIRLKRLDPERQEGVFGQAAVTGRLWTSAATISSDYLAIDSRLKRIRVRTELLLAKDQDPG